MAWLTKNYNTHIAQISRIKGSKTMKFGQLMEYPKRNIFLYAENEAGKLIPDRYLFFKKALY